MVCPQCSQPVEKVHGAIEETVFRKYPLRNGDATRRRVRPAVFYACMTCEWCSETKPEGLTNAA